MSRTVLVTGASRGIGEATARRFAADGDRVAVLARPSERLSAVAASLGALEVTADVSESEQIDAAVRRVADALGPIEVLVNNAGVAARQTVEGHPVELWDHLQAVNLRAPFLFARAVLPAMLTAGRGRIINVSSIAGRVGTPERSAYCASKWGLLGFTKALSSEVKSAGVVVTAICPGSVDTEMLVGSGFEPEMEPVDIASAIHFLAAAPPAIAGAALDMFA